VVTPSFPGFRDGMVDVQEVVPLSVRLLEEWLKLMEKCKDSEEEDWNEELTGLIDKTQQLLRRVYEDPNIVQLYACRGED
jgi:hypothetical protein